MSHKFTDAERNQLWSSIYGDKERGTCYLCNDNQIKRTYFDMAHILAKSKTGSNHLDNILPLCGECNRGTEIVDVTKYKFPKECTHNQNPCKQILVIPKVDKESKYDDDSTKIKLIMKHSILDEETSKKTIRRF